MNEFQHQVTHNGYARFHSDYIRFAQGKLPGGDLPPHDIFLTFLLRIGDNSGLSVRYFCTMKSQSNDILQPVPIRVPVYIR